MIKTRSFNLLLMVFLICFPFIGKSQGISNNWLMGYESYAGLPWGNTLIDFSTGYPDTFYQLLPMEFHQTHANISDSLGNLLFYTNGVYIADATHDTMMNGSGLNPGSYTNSHQFGLLIPQSAIILPKPGSQSIYYLFHNTLDNYLVSSELLSFQLYLTIIDMSANGGLGTVVQKNIPIVVDSLNPGKITATKHANGRDWWLICNRANTNMFYKLLITPYGLPIVTTQNIGTVRASDAGQAKFSPNGFWYAYYYDLNGLDIMNFDRCTGILSNFVHDVLPNPPGVNMGCEFSPFSDMLYVTNVTHVFQYSLGSNILASKQLVATYDNFLDSIIPGFAFGTYLCQPQLAPDGKIYITTGNSTRYFHTIHYPYFPGIACSLVQHDLNVPALYSNTIPNHPNYFLGVLTGSPCDTITGVGINEVDNIELQVWPNPFNDYFTLSFPVRSTGGKLEIYDVLGKNVFEELVAPWSQYKKVIISNQPPGIYLIKITWKEYSGIVKVLKN